MNSVSHNSAILRDALEQDDHSDEPKTILEIGVSIKRSASTMDLASVSSAGHLVTLPSASAAKHSLHYATGEMSPPSPHHHQIHAPHPHHPGFPTHHLHHQHQQHLNHHPIASHHSNPSPPYSLTMLHRPLHWPDSGPEMLVPSAFPQAYNSDVNYGVGGGNNLLIVDSRHQDLTKTSRSANANWKDRAIQIEKGNDMLVKVWLWIIQIS